VNILKKYDLRKIINAAGTYTFIGGSVLPPEVINAMSQAAQIFVDMDELQEKASQIIANITGAESAYVTSGCSAALTLAAAACMTQGDPVKIQRLPDSKDMKNEIVIHRSHRNVYDLSFRNAGAKLIEIGLVGPGGIFGTNEWELKQAINQNTAAIAYVLSPLVISRSVIPLPRVVDIAHEQGVPVILDSAAELPPVSNLKKFIKLGVDLVAFSGGKAIRGPNASGFICGRKDLIEMCRVQGSPHYGIGRPMKAGKEEIFGLLAAIEWYTTKDHQAELDLWEKRVQYILEGISKLKGVHAIRKFPTATGRPIPTVHLTVDRESLQKTAHKVVSELESGDPSIRICKDLLDSDTIILNPSTLMVEDEKRILEELRMVLI